MQSHSRTATSVIETLVIITHGNFFCLPARVFPLSASRHLPELTERLPRDGLQAGDDGLQLGSRFDNEIETAVAALAQIFNPFCDIFAFGIAGWERFQLGFGHRDFLGEIEDAVERHGKPQD